ASCRLNVRSTCLWTARTAPGRRSSTRGVPWAAVATQYVGERAVGASRMQHILASGHGGTRPTDLACRVRCQHRAKHADNAATLAPGFISNPWHGQLGRVLPSPANGEAQFVRVAPGSLRSPNYQAVVFNPTGRQTVYRALFLRGACPGGRRRTTQPN